MRRKSLILALLVVLILLGGVGTALALLVSHEPAYYRRGAIAAGKQRQIWSNQFFEEFMNLCNALQHDDLTWRAEFTPEQINAYLQEGFISSGLDEKMLPDRVENPRFALDEDRLRLGFRYGRGRWTAIITIDLRLWIAQGEPNTVALELLGLHAGALPISAQSLLEYVSDAARRMTFTDGQRVVDVSWFRHNGHPVALLRFGPDRPRSTVHLTHVELKAGQIILQGRSAASSAPTTSTASN